MIVWGGEADEMSSELFSDGAAYNPDTESWRLLPTSPLSGRRYHLAAWTGEEMLIVGGVGEKDGAAYNPASDSWRSIEEALIPVGPPAGTGISGLVGEAWTGKELVAWHVASNQIAAYNPVADQWRQLPAPPLAADLGVLRWNGTDLYAVAANTSIYPQDVPLLLARFTDGGDEWKSLPEIGLSTEIYNIGARPELTAWAGKRLLAWSDSGVDGRTVAFDPRSRSWADVAPTPLHGCEAAPEPLTLDDRVLAYDWCGPDAIYEQTSDTWTSAHIDGSPQARYTVWTGTEVLNWGDTCCYGTGGEPFTIQAWMYKPEG
jgi:hypothetical protein